MDEESPSGPDHATLRRYLQRLEDNIRQISRRLKRFEDEFGMDSEKFYAKLQNAELDERVDAAGPHRALGAAHERVGLADGRLHLAGRYLRSLLDVHGIRDAAASAYIYSDFLVHRLTPHYRLDGPEGGTSRVLD